MSTLLQFIGILTYAFLISVALLILIIRRYKER